MLQTPRNNWRMRLALLAVVIGAVFVIFLAPRG